TLDDVARAFFAERRPPAALTLDRSRFVDSHGNRAGAGDEHDTGLAIERPFERRAGVGDQLKMIYAEPAGQPFLHGVVMNRVADAGDGGASGGEVLRRDVRLRAGLLDGFADVRDRQIKADAHRVRSAAEAFADDLV